MKIKHVFLDLDEVLADFVGGACKVHGKTVEELDKEFGSDTPPHWWGGTKFWKPIHEAGEGFWASLEPLPWAQNLAWSLDIFCRHNGWYWTLLTAPSIQPSSHRGKIIWIKRFFGSSFQRFIITQQKYLLAKPGAVLIDDSCANCDAFIQEGGHAILFPGRRATPPEGGKLDRVEWVLSQLETLKTL